MKGGGVESVESRSERDREVILCVCGWLLEDVLSPPSRRCELQLRKARRNFRPYRRRGGNGWLYLRSAPL